MKTYNKIIEKDNYKFNVKIELDTRLERGLEGKRFSTVILNEMGLTNFYKKWEVRNTELIDFIDNTIPFEITYFLNEKKQNPLEKELIKMGFEKD